MPKGECEICGAVDELEDRRLLRSRFSLCGACREVADGEYLTEESVAL